MNVELVRDSRPWYDDHDNLADLYRYLVETEPHTDFEYWLRKPWKWESTYKAMRNEEEMDRLLEEQAAFDGDDAA